MKAIRKLLAMALVVVMVLSMSTFVFATEEIQPRSCAHDIVHRQTYRFKWRDQSTCDKYIDFYEQCSKCGYVFYTTTSGPYPERHVVEGTYCVQCKYNDCV